MAFTTFILKSSGGSYVTRGAGAFLPIVFLSLVLLLWCLEALPPTSGTKKTAFATCSGFTIEKRTICCLHDVINVMLYVIMGWIKASVSGGPGPC